MKLDFIDHDKLFVDKTNMRHAVKNPDVTDLLPSVRKRGVIVPLVVRAANEDGLSGIVAGSRRWKTNASSGPRASITAHCPALLWKMATTQARSRRRSSRMSPGWTPTR